MNFSLFSLKSFINILLLALTTSSHIHASTTVSTEALDFTLKSAMGNEVKLSSLKGKWVVLEWYNKDCPFVLKHYDTENMQKLQKNILHLE